MRRGLVGAGLAMTLVLVGLSALTAVNAMARQTVKEDHVYGFKGKAVSMDLTVGEVLILPSQVDDQISVRRVMTYGLSRPVVEERIDGDTFRVHDGECAMSVGAICHVRWLLQVPSKLHLTISTRAGNITVNPGMTGAVNLTSISGEVKARGLTGPAVQLLSRMGSVSGTGLRSSHVVANSITGNISLTFRTPPKFVQGKSTTGFVEVVVPDGEEFYRVMANGASKAIYAKHDASSSRKIIVVSQKGPVTVRDVSSTGEEEQSSANPGP